LSGAGPDDTWKRPDCVQGTGEEFLYGPSGRPRYEDVRQINLGNCWLMAALASVANTQPDIIREMIYPVEKKDSSGNTLKDSSGNTLWEYEVILHFDGEPVMITVDEGSRRQVQALSCLIRKPWQSNKALLRLHRKKAKKQSRRFVKTTTLNI